MSRKVRHTLSLTAPAHVAWQPADSTRLSDRARCSGNAALRLLFLGHYVFSHRLLRRFARALAWPADCVDCPMFQLERQLGQPLTPLYAATFTDQNTCTVTHRRPGTDLRGTQASLSFVILGGSTRCLHATGWRPSGNGEAVVFGCQTRIRSRYSGQALRCRPSLVPF